MSSRDQRTSQFVTISGNSACFQLVNSGFFQLTDYATHQIFGIAGGSKLESFQALAWTDLQLYTYSTSCVLSFLFSSLYSSVFLCFLPYFWVKSQGGNCGEHVIPNKVPLVCLQARIILTSTKLSGCVKPDSSFYVKTMHMAYV